MAKPKGLKVYEVWVGRAGNKPNRVGVWGNRDKAEMVRLNQDKLLNEYGDNQGRPWIAWIEAKRLGTGNDKFNHALAEAVSKWGAVTPSAVDHWAPQGSLPEDPAGS